YPQFKAYSQPLNKNTTHHITHLLQFKPSTPIHIHQLQPLTHILKPFNTPPITYPSISPEAHQTLPQPINQLPANSNTPQPDQHPKRYQLQVH
ncbi:glutamate synthase-related protein, partial [Staphylococcus aureus]|uniref:glutamate synthase-related protein n=1 Tax=Staphylococcus aureus TaxID=1280 RepID=UPI001642FA49